LVVEALRAGYGARAILHDISFVVQAGEIRVILGGSGAGKSTLLKHIIGLLPPSQGQVRLLGCDLARADDNAREQTLRRVGMLFQSGALLNAMSVRDNVALPLRQSTRLPEALINDVAMMKLALVGLEAAAHKMPPELSGGMKKRAALARAMVLDPDILFCDEPSAGLDPITAAGIDHLILQLRDQFGMAIVVVTHELASIRTIADTALMLDGGSIVADGTLQEVMAQNTPVIRGFFDRQAQDPTKTRPSMLEVLGQEAQACI
jgi:phospholipid/cholesterol/gamma-HCH transport system ATP-binding protein